MEKQPEFSVTSKIFFLLNTDELNQYINACSEIANNPHKYDIIDNTIANTKDNEPYVYLQYLDNGMKENKKKNLDFFANIFFKSDLPKYDQIVGDYLNKKLQIIYDQHFISQNGFFTKLIIYVVRVGGKGAAEVDRITPKSGSR